MTTVRDPKDHTPYLTLCVRVYNAETRIGEVLDAIAGQTDVLPEEWEVLVVNNNSTDGTAAIVKQWLPSSPTFARLINEPRQGGAYVRRRGCMDARGGVVAFLDDDNIPGTDWVRQTIDFFVSHPQAGMAGGRILARLEEPAPPWWDDVKWMLAICDAMTEGPVRRDGAKIPGVCEIPVGAGMCVRRDVMKTAYERFGFFLSGPLGASRASNADDIEIGARILQLGWESWFVPSLVMEHVIPSKRLESVSLLKLRSGIVRSNVIIEAMRRFGTYPPPFGYALKVAYWAALSVRKGCRSGAANDFQTQLQIATNRGRLYGAIRQLRDTVIWKKKDNRHA